MKIWIFTRRGIPGVLMDGMMLDDASASPSSMKSGLGAMGLDEQNQLSLAIQNSLYCTAEEDDLKRALELSKQQGSYTSYQMSAQHSMPRCHSTLLEDIKAANMAQVTVFAGVDSDLIRSDIALGKKVSLRQVEERMEQNGLKDMSEFHHQCVLAIKRKHAVEIQTQGNILTVSGFKDFVAEALPDVRLLLSRISSRRNESELLSNIQWARQGIDTSAMTPYSPENIVFIENTWRMKEKEMAILLNGQPHIINLVKMQEYNVATGKAMNVVRTVLSGLDLDIDVQEEQCSLLSKLPDVAGVDESSVEFQEVVKNFYSTIEEYHSKIKIIKVEKLENRLLYNQYKLKKASLYQSGIHKEVERTLYHGTSESSVKEICLHGFNRSFCGKNATVYGQGVYFALNSSLSLRETYSPPNRDKLKFVFVAKVLTGDYTLGCNSMKAAPLKESDDIPLRYDSVTDNLNKPSMFVIFNDTQAYPEYLITCQEIHR
ncbi:Poly [ADP-ribose] polymerase 10 [Merluccius polli]|uniref:Poly [ADP-ribose] polymerase n=1 Tax=Merluccius polli TaxID=89951 RepID=A0AA47N1N2_MERPO|nr:Poly [ADP-ribose] polymerase 10 [Merluccius polli]